MEKHAAAVWLAVPEAAGARVSSSGSGNSSRSASIRRVAVPVAAVAVPAGSRGVAVPAAQEVAQ